MSIEEKSVEPVVVNPSPATQNLTPSHKIWATILATLRSPLWLCLLVALLIRVWLIYHTHGVIDGDEAMVGIQAEHILRGEHPIYYYGQAYMGSLEAYLMAILFAIAGPSVWMLRAEPTLLSLVVVYLTWRLARAFAREAQLPPYATLLFQTIAALLAALSPLYDTVLELRTLGGYVETFVLMLLLLLSAYQLTRRWRAGASRKELALRWAGIGFIVGLGFWVNPLIASAVIAAALWIIAFCIAELLRLSRQKSTDTGNQPARAPRHFWQEFLLVAVAIPACIVGLLPALRWGYSYHWANFTYITQLNDMKSLNILLIPTYHTNRLLLIHDVTYFYEKYAAPRVISGALPIESPLMAAIHRFTLGLGLLCIVMTLLCVILSLVVRHPLLQRIRQLGALPLLFALCTAIAFCTSIASAAGLISFQNDIAGRYATPLMLVLPFFFALPFTLASMAAYSLMHQRRSSVTTATANDISPTRQQRRSGSFVIGLSIQILLGALLLAYLGGQAYTFALTDPNTTYQSASCPTAPANNDPIIAYLQQQHVHYAWAITWIGNPIIFKTDNSIILADPRPIMAYNGLGRIPAYTEDLLHADRPAMLSIITSHDSSPILLKTLDSLHVTYTAARFPSEPGFQVLVVTSLSRTVSLHESKGFWASFPGCI